MSKKKLRNILIGRFSFNLSIEKKHQSNHQTNPLLLKGQE